MEDKFFDKIYKDKRMFVLFAIFIAFLSSLPGFIDLTYVNKDLTFHIYRIQEMANNIVNSNVWLPALQPNNVLGYGYLVDIFYPNLFLYPAAFITILIKNPLTAFKILIFIYSLFTFYTSFMSSKIATGHDKFSFYFATLYVLYPYKILNFYANGFVGEFFAYAFLPLIIFGTNKLFKEGKWKMLALGMTGILYSHLITLLLASIYIAIYCVFNIKNIIKNKFIIINLIKTTIMTICMGIGFLVPFISYMNSDSYKFNMNADLSGILSYGLFNLPIYLEIVIQIILIYLCIRIFNKYKEKFEDSNILKCYIISVYSIVIITKIFPWELFDNIPFLRNIQFSIRILSFIAPIMVFMFAEFSLILKDMNKIFILLFSAIIFTYISVNEFTIKPEDRVIVNLEEIYTEEENFISGTYFDIIAGEYMPDSFSVGDIALFDLSHEDLLKNNDVLFEKEVISYDLIRNNTLTTILKIETNEIIDVYLPLTYYQNYKAYYNEQELEIFEDNGRLAIKDVSSGEIIIKYEVSELQKNSAAISLISLIIFTFLIINDKYSLKNILQNRRIMV